MVIDVRGVSITLGEFSLKSIDLHVEEGEYFVILGPTGAGKTVLVECIVGLHAPDAGRVFLDGADVTDLRPEHRNVAYVPQDYCLFPNMTVARNIGFGLRIRKRSEQQIEQRVNELAALLHIEGLLGRHPLTLSGGEKQRVALARALAIEPRVLLLDEPLAAVDERTRERLCDELNAVQRELGTTTVHVSHNFEETLAVADHIGIFDDGRIMQVGTPQDVFHRPSDEFVADFVGCENIVSGHVEAGGDGAVFIAGQLRLAVNDGRMGDARLVIRPERIRLHPGADGGAENCLPARVVHVVDKGPMLKVYLEAGGIRWAVLVPRQHLTEEQLPAGAELQLVVPRDHVHIIPASEQPVR